MYVFCRCMCFVGVHVFCVWVCLHRPLCAYVFCVYIYIILYFVCVCGIYFVCECIGVCVHVFTLWWAVGVGVSLYHVS